MDNTINSDIIEKATIKRVAIYKAIGMLPPITTKDLWEEKNSIEPKMNCENKNVSEINDTMKDTKMSSTQNDWRDITNPKLKEKMRNREVYKRYREKNKDKIKAYREANKDKYKAWYEANRDKRLKKEKNYYEINKDKIKERGKTYREKHKDKIKLRNKLYREANRDEIKIKKTLYARKKLKTDIDFKLKLNLRSRLRITLKNNYKSGSAISDLGCTIDELKSYLESKFQPGMSWDNHGIHGWHIDHIKPLASFDLSDRKQMLEACHYTNLQPLWAKDNLSKSDKLIY
jgi:hypothetical protein